MSLRDPHEPHSSSADELRTLNDRQRGGEPFLAWRDAAGALRTFVLAPAARVVTIGRAPRSGILVDWDDHVSAVHAKIEPLDDEWTIVDDGISRNGTFVGGERVNSSRRLRDQDRIVVGTTVIAFHGGTGGLSETKLAGDVVQRSQLSDSKFSVLRALCRPLVFGESDEPPTNAALAGEVFLTEEGVKRCLTRLYVDFSIKDEPKRKRLAQRAIATGLVSRNEYR